MLLLILFCLSGCIYFNEKSVKTRYGETILKPHVLTIKNNWYFFENAEQISVRFTFCTRINIFYPKFKDIEAFEYFNCKLY